MKFKLTVVIAAVACALLAAVLYSLAWSREATEIYRQRLAGLSQEYESLRHRYNQAVQKTAVTELLVDHGKLSVAVRTIDGVHKTIPTPFNPAHEIYVDYVLLDGRLWIRRVFDSQTPPGRGLVIDPDKQTLDWNSKNLHSHGKAIYRSLTDGRWIVTVTGDGSLGLKKVSDDSPVELAPPPVVRDYDQVQREVSSSIEHITAGQVLRRILLGRES